MTIKQIEHFLKLYELKNVSQVAKSFDISQSAVSNSIKELESSLNGNLFDRIGKNLIPNQKGKQFFEEVLPLYKNIKELEERMKFARILRLNLLSSQNVGVYLLSNLIGDLARQYSLKFAIANTHKIITEILEHRCDVGLIESNITSPNITKIKIVNDELVVVCGDKSFANKSFYIDEIAGFEWIMREDGSGTRQTFLAGIPKGVEINVVLEINSTEAIKNAIKGKRLFSVLPKFALEDGIYPLKIKNIKFSRDLSIVFHAKKANDDKFMELITRLKDSLAAFYSFSVPSCL
ncbi:transcriptional regulator, LysR family [Campylobacter iguaniorum]|uniref:Transcriptional regulator, LysR family n=1 Tax=Campylobacter iguaniorum TaxID=1244531 RepID=A0A076FC55_9BACT|nr:LysR family transcriptional regulator [Campylobacter iguaniorum]AII15253.1 transcriptional regulator, LysR family [Campylobacter iguaniorum]